MDNQLKSFVKSLISLYNVDYDTFVKLTGFSDVGGYANDKWNKFQSKPLYEFLNYDDGIKTAFYEWGIK